MMQIQRRRQTRRTAGRSGFTLVELLVVVSIIALLISILLPSLRGARESAKATQCGTNLHHVGQAMAIYTSESGGTFPVSYLYPKDAAGNYDLRNADPAKPYGYAHWSWYLYASGKVNDDGFQCPSFEKGGAPRTNPGPIARNWEVGEQSDQDGRTEPNTHSLEDKQASRMAYTANAALVPRNKFTRLLSGGQRVNQYVNETKVKRAGGTILATEFIKNWKAITKPGSSGNAPESRSHRPINPFYHVGTQYNEYTTTAPGFIYGLPDDQKTYGLATYDRALKLTSSLDHESGVMQVNAVGRHHPGGNKVMGGTANFLFVDTHVERLTVLETMERRMWGDRYYSVDGDNKVLNMAPVHTGNP